MKFKSCPKCGSKNLGDRWCKGRMLQQYCAAEADFEEDECNWVGEPRTPERRRVTNTKDLRVDNFYGWDFIIYDRFGHTSTLSQSFDTKAEAVKEMEEDLKRGEKDTAGGPYTAVLFFTPANVKLKGTMFKMKGGVCTKATPTK